MRWIHPATLAILLGAASLLGFALWQDRPPRALPIEALTSFQDADAPLLLPADGQPRHRLHRFSGWQLGEMPTATRFDSPLGSAHGALTYNAQKFWDMNEKRGGHHAGDDLNGIGGMNTDLGDPVHAVADGLVVFAGEPSPGWGPVVVIAHRDHDGRLLESMYAHLDRIDVAVGTLVHRGRKIGSLGTANGYYPAHLHFEIRHGDGVDIGGGYGMIPLNRLDPSKTLAELAGSAPDDLSPSPLASALIPRDEPWTGLEIQGAEKLGEILGK
ncbi:MAG: M23 family metallopeptidase [Verrucomicrobia bacterium]|nr:MAG: M23 family metallopeptidase [Verrucomicrobiota bacterium]TAE86905.1 MAG: M23 family metallopeptidase [Verrucomicrobiota bacterium]TAF24677.1 MAG: M23 family metallopeptidase [Verrucomicrobiota bacterium]TAF40411.1 MAG: M23 family metallopeptidase [Verrucomicrobiota bacterium]